MADKNQLLRATSSFSRNKAGLSATMKSRLKSATPGGGLNENCINKYTDYKHFDLI